jgi:hypothetical protein
MIICVWEFDFKLSSTRSKSSSICNKRRLPLGLGQTSRLVPCKLKQPLCRSPNRLLRTENFTVRSVQHTRKSSVTRHPWGIVHCATGIYALHYTPKSVRVNEIAKVLGSLAHVYLLLVLNYGQMRRAGGNRRSDELNENRSASYLS